MDLGERKGVSSWVLESNEQRWLQEGFGPDSPEGRNINGS